MGRATCAATFKISKKFRNIKLSRTPLSSLISLFNLYNSLKFVSREIKIKILRIAINSNNNDCLKFSFFFFISRLRENYVFWTMLYELVESEPFFSLYTTNIIVSPWNGSFCLIVLSSFTVLKSSKLWRKFWFLILNIFAMLTIISILDACACACERLDAYAEFNFRFTF